MLFTRQDTRQAMKIQQAKLGDEIKQGEKTWMITRVNRSEYSPGVTATLQDPESVCGASSVIAVFTPKALRSFSVA
jgi:hypothetical protein